MHCGRCGTRLTRNRNRGCLGYPTHIWGMVCIPCWDQVVARWGHPTEGTNANQAKADMLVQGVPVATPGGRREVQPACAASEDAAQVRAGAEGQRSMEALPLTQGYADAKKGRA